MKTTKYIPVWQVQVGGRLYRPAAPGRPATVIEGLPDDEIKRLLKMGAIRRLEYIAGASNDEDPKDEDEEETKLQPDPVMNQTPASPEPSDDPRLDTVPMNDDSRRGGDPSPPDVEIVPDMVRETEGAPEPTATSYDDVPSPVNRRGRKPVATEEIK